MDSREYGDPHHNASISVSLRRNFGEYARNLGTESIGLLLGLGQNLPRKTVGSTFEVDLEAGHLFVLLMRRLF